MCILDFDALCGTGMAEDKELHNELRLLVGLKEKPIVPEPCGEAERLWAYLVDEEVPEAELEQCTDLDKAVRGPDHAPDCGCLTLDA